MHIPTAALNQVVLAGWGEVEADLEAVLEEVVGEAVAEGELDSLLRLSLGHSQRHQTGHLAGHAQVVNHIHYISGRLVDLGGFLGQHAGTGGPDHDAVFVQGCFNALSGEELDGLAPAHDPARAVAGRAEGQIQGGVAAAEDIGGCAHAAGNYHRLAHER